MTRREPRASFSLLRVRRHRLGSAALGALIVTVLCGPLSPAASAATSTSNSTSTAASNSAPAAHQTSKPTSKPAATKASASAKSASPAALPASLTKPVIGRDGVAESRLLTIADTLQAHPPSAGYAGVAVDPTSGMVDLYLTDVAAGARAAAEARFPASQRTLIRVHRAPLTRASLQADVDRVGDIGARLVAEHIPFQSYGPDFEHGYVLVGLVDPTAAQSAAAARAFSGLPVHLSSVARQQLDSLAGRTPPASLSDCTNLANRACDNAPWTGGDFIYNSDGVNCSDSWPISYGGKTYIMTAGHCDETGATWQNGSTVGRIGSSTVLGAGTSNLYSSQLDVQLISVSSSRPSIWVGTYPADTPATQFAYRAPVMGESVCVDGAYDGMQCTGTGEDSLGRALGITDIDFCEIVDNDDVNSKICGLATANGVSNQVLVGAGDSGGPVFAATSGGVTPLGLVSNSGSGLPCEAFPSRGDECSDSVDFTMMSSIMSSYAGAALMPPVTPPSGQPACQSTVQPASSGTDIDFYHGTSLANAEKIAAGIDPSFGDGYTDFGAGFYITTDENQAVAWAKKASNNYVDPTVVHLRVPAALFTTAASCGRVFDENGQVAETDDFLDFVRYMRTNKPNPGGMGYDFVEGPLLINPTAFLNGEPAITDGQQDAIFATSRNLDEAFDAGYLGYAPAGNPAAWVVGHAQHAGNDYPYETVGQFGHTNEGTDAWNEYYGQCDSFAAWKAYENLAGSAAQHPAGAVPATGWVPTNASVSPINQFAAWTPGAGPGGNADVWAAQAENWGATVDNVPTPGAIAWWPNAVTDPQDGNPPDTVHGIPGSSTGHVGYVTDVYPDGSITVEQYNMRENGEYSVVHMNYDTGYVDNSFGLTNFSVPWPGGFIHLGDGPAAGVASPAEPAPGVVQAGYPTQVKVLGPGDGHNDFTLTGAAYPQTVDGWSSDAGHGEDGQMLYTNTHPGAADSTATWTAHLTANTCYEVDAFVPDNWSNNDAALYAVSDQHFGSSLIPVDENATTDDWVELGVFEARSTDGTLPVTLTDQGSGTGQVAADAMRYVPQGNCSGLVRASARLRQRHAAGRTELPGDDRRLVRLDRQRAARQPGIHVHQRNQPERLGDVDGERDPQRLLRAVRLRAR